MKRLSFLSLLCAVFFFTFLTASAQLIKLPKLPKKPADPVQQPAAATETRSTEAKPVSTSSRRSGGPYAVKPPAPETPLFLAETLEVGVEHWDYYWKIPNDNHNTSWVPRINFDVYYGGSTKLRLKAEYFMPDGTLWFSEALDHRGMNDSHSGASRVSSDSSSGDRDKKAIVVGGLFGIKITNIRDNSTMFQGKFKVGRYKPKFSDARYKNEVDYYVDYDWKLPVAIADLDWERDNATPTIRMWFKGDLKTDGFEAQLFKDGKQIATTDNGGGVGTGERYYADKRGDDDSLFWREFTFAWPSRAEFIVTEDLRNFTSYKDTLFINQMPGEYVVKVSYNGEPVRETSFSVGNDGMYADNGMAKRSGLSTNKVFLPVKVMGTIDKWNPANAKSMGFYGNPVQ